MNSRAIFEFSGRIFMILPKYDCKLSEFDIKSLKIKNIICFQIISALKYMHDNNYLHLDLTTDNILIKLLL